MKNLHKEISGSKWRKLSDHLPENGEEVLVRSRGIINLARYSAQSRSFLLKDGVPLQNDRAGILWAASTRKKDER